MTNEYKSIDDLTIGEILGLDDGLVFEIPQNGSLRGERENRPTICFATMCKNEEHCIRETMESCAPYVDYWIIADTGSTDGTLQVIQDFWREKDIPGRLYQHEWKGFDVNKTIMFDKARGRCDYILHLDADDLLVGNFKFTKADAGFDRYYFNTKRGASNYKSICLWNGRCRWRWCGVAHTTVKCLDPPPTGTRIADFSDRSFFHHSRDTGSRSHDPQKYYKDALRLRDQFFRTLVSDPDGLNARSVFYCAQSYYDSHHWEEACQWYALYTRLKGNWFEEDYESNMRIAHAMRRMNNSDPRIEEFYKKAINIIPERAEAHYHLGKYYNSRGRWQHGYNELKIAASKDFKHCQTMYTLFVNQNCYGKYVQDELSVSCYWLGKKEEGISYTNAIINDPNFAHEKKRLERNLQFLSQLEEGKAPGK